MPKTLTKTTTGTMTKPGDEADEIRSRLVELHDLEGDTWYEECILLYQVYHRELWTLWKKGNKKFESFEDYADKELGLAYRTAMERKDAGNAILKLGLPKERIRALGISKFKEIAVLVDENTTDKQFHDLEAHASKHTAREVKDFVQSERYKKIGGEKIAKVTFTFTVNKESANVINEALKIAGEVAQTENVGRLFTYISANFQMTFTGSAKAHKAILEAIPEEKKAEKVPHKEHSKPEKKAKAKAPKTKAKAEKKGAGKPQESEAEVEL